MAKELPYFQFEPAEYLTKDISFCSLSAQGLFINICSFYWQRQCKLTKEQFLRRFNYPNEFDELLNEGVIDVLDNYIIIKFLDLQYNNATKKSQTNSQNGSKGGRPKKQNETELKPNKNQNETELKGIREDKIKEEEIKIDNKKFVDECLISSQWLEVICMQKKLSIDKAKEKLKEFEIHLITTGEQKKYLEDFKSHFNNWLNKKEKDKPQNKWLSPI